MIRITNGDRTTELAWDGAPVSVSRLLERAGLHPDRPCGGQGRCGKCRVLARGDLSPAAPEERKHLTAAELNAGVRLACMARISGPDADIGLPREVQLLVETGLPLHRLTWEPWAAGLGVSVDIGTTTVAAYLWDLDGRRQLGVASCKNPQERLGADVVSRLDASLAGRGGELRTCITACIAELARRLCRQAGRPVTDIGGAVGMLPLPPGVVQPAAQIDHRRVGVVLQIVPHLEGQIALPHGRLQYAEPPHQAPGLLFQRCEVVVDLVDEPDGRIVPVKVRISRTAGAVTGTYLRTAPTQDFPRSAGGWSCRSRRSGSPCLRRHRSAVGKCGGYRGASPP